MSLRRNSIAKCECGFDLRNCNPIPRNISDLAKFIQANWSQLSRSEQIVRSPHCRQGTEVDLCKLTDLLEFIREELEDIRSRPWTKKLLEITELNQVPKNSCDSEWIKYYMIKPILDLDLSFDSIFSLVSHYPKFERFVLIRYYSMIWQDCSLTNNKLKFHKGGDKLLADTTLLILKSFQYYNSYSNIFFLLTGRGIEDTVITFLASEDIVRLVTIHWFSGRKNTVFAKDTCSMQDLNSLLQKVRNGLYMNNLTFMDILSNRDLSKANYNSIERHLSLYVRR